jgi:hypothetical protein
VPLEQQHGAAGREAQQTGVVGVGDAASITCSPRSSTSP